MRSSVLAALRDPAQKNNRDYVDVIIALGMAKEGFDWIWCEHALTIGYRSSLTEIVQIIGRATRDAEGKERARFTNLIAEPAAEQAAVAEAVNDMLKAILRQLADGAVLALRYDFHAQITTARRRVLITARKGTRTTAIISGVNNDTGQITSRSTG
jgi:superfamily II DNA or RNA helicase